MTTFEGPVRLSFYIPLLIAVGLASGCNSLQRTSQSQSQPSPLPSLSPSPSPAVSPQPKVNPVIFTLSVLDPLSELKIKTGMFIQKGQIIADQTNERLRLTTQKKNLEAQLVNVSQNQILNATTEPEEKAIAIALEQKAVAEAALNSYQQDSPWTDFARTNLPLAEEEVKVTRLESEVKRAQLNLEVAEAKLEQKRAAIQNLQQAQITQTTELQASLGDIEKKLLSLKPITAPQSGTITNIAVPTASQPGQLVKVTVTLLPGLTPQEAVKTDPPTTAGTSSQPSTLPTSPSPSVNTGSPSAPEFNPSAPPISQGTAPLPPDTE